MALYRYVKQTPHVGIRIPRSVSFMFILSGMCLLVWTVWPIFSFSFTSFQLTKTISPVSDTKHIGFSQTYAGKIAEESSNQTVDYSDANVWFPTKPQKHIIAPINSYFLSVPKLHIASATVVIAGDDLNVSLIHYGGTPLPGEYGNAVIFGHSTLPQFYKPTNYKTIFSLLPSLEIGDNIYITIDGVEYKYTVFEKIVVDPTDLSPLEQKFDDSYVTLVTCVPPGTYWKRLNVKAKLEKTL